MQVFQPGDTIYLPLPIAVSGTSDSFDGFLLDRASGGGLWDFARCVVVAPILAKYSGPLGRSGVDLIDEYLGFMCQQSTMLVRVMEDGLVAALPEDRMETSSRAVPRGLMVQTYGTAAPIYMKRAR